MARRLQPPVAATAEVDGGLALDAFGDVDVELDTVVAHGDTGGAIYGRTTGCAEDPGEPESVGYLLEYVKSGYVHGGVFLGGDERSNGVCPSEGQHLNGVVDLHCYSGIPVRTGGFPLLYCIVLYLFVYLLPAGGGVEGRYCCGDVEMRRDWRVDILLIRVENYPANLI